MEKLYDIGKCVESVANDIADLLNDIEMTIFEAEQNNDTATVERLKGYHDMFVQLNSILDTDGGIEALADLCGEE